MGKRKPSELPSLPGSAKSWRPLIRIVERRVLRLPADLSAPQVLAEAPDYLLAYKPPAMHSSPVKARPGETLAARIAALFPEIRGLQGRRPGEGGLMHRLDYETQGLVLFARTQRGADSLLAQQEEGKIAKEYSALVSRPGRILPGFPPFPQAVPGGLFPRLIESPFRAWGPGRRAVRPAFPGTAGGRKLAFDKGSPYQTRIQEWREEAAPSAPLEGLTVCRAAIIRGFRHQIRCHLAWLGFPILNDSLYGGAGEGLLALRACSLSFADPLDGAGRSFELPALSAGDFSSQVFQA